MLTERDIGAMLTNQLFGMIRNDKHSYISKVGVEYCHLHPEGEKLMLEMVNLLFKKAVECEKQRNIEFAQQHMMDSLKK
jgi:hypothetical protein